MLLSTFNFNRSLTYSFFFFLFFIAIFLTYELNIRKDPGNLMIIADQTSTKEFDLKKQDLIILGSSRAVESIRPNFFVKNFNQFSEVLNFSCHSCNLLEHQINPILKEFSDIKNLKKKMIITVEPFLFKKMKNADNLINDQKNSHHYEFYKKIKSFGSKLIFTWCESCRPENRRHLHLWIAFCFSTIKDLFETKYFSLNILKKNYNYWITQRANAFSVEIVHRDKGFEGMQLVINDTSISLSEIFKKHQKFYPTHLANFDKEKIKEVEKKLEILKKKNVDIVMLRLPIHSSLFEIENKFVPEFNKLMNDLSAKLDVPYIDFNKSDKKYFTNDPLNFTDSSHLRFSATKKFNTLLVKELQEIWN